MTTNQNQRAYFETPVLGNSPNGSVIGTNERYWTTDNPDGIPCPVTESAETFIELHDVGPNEYLTAFVASRVAASVGGVNEILKRFANTELTVADKATVEDEARASTMQTFRNVIARTEDGALALQVFRSTFVVRYGEPDKVRPNKVQFMAADWSTEEEMHMVQDIVLPEDFDEMFRAVRDGADPTDKDREECKLATAVDRLLKRHIFLGLTDEILKAVQEHRMDVYLIREGNQDYMERTARRSFDMKNLQSALTGHYPGMTVPERFKDGAKRGIIFTAADSAGNPRGICYYEMPTEWRRGIIVAFETALFTQARLSVHHMLLNWYPTFLWQFPPPPYKEETNRQEYRPRRNRHPEGRRARRDADTSAGGGTPEKCAPETDTTEESEVSTQETEVAPPPEADASGEPEAPDQADEDPPTLEKLGDEDVKSGKPDDAS